MDHNSKNQYNLGVNKLGKGIRKSPLPQQQPPPPPPPQIYNISQSDFRSIVQQLTGAPSRDPSPAPLAPVLSPQPKPHSSRLMKNRPPPLSPISYPPAPHFPNPVANPNPNVINPSNRLYTGPMPSPPTAPAGTMWSDSPVSSYMRYLESSLLSSDSSRQPFAEQQQSSSLYPATALQSLLPSPATQFPLPSPTTFLNLLSPKTPYPPFSPVLQHPPPITSNSTSSPMPQSGILGAFPGSQPPPSPSFFIPPSPSGLLPLLSPRWWQ